MGPTANPAAEVVLLHGHHFIKSIGCRGIGTAVNPHQATRLNSHGLALGDQDGCIEIG
jgi:hypothetical protein